MARAAKKLMEDLLTSPELHLFGSVASILGLVISLPGLFYAIWRLLRQNERISSVISQVDARLLGMNISLGIDLAENLAEACIRRDWYCAAEHGKLLGTFLQQNIDSTGIDKAGKEVFVSAIEDLVAVSDEIDTIRKRGEKENLSARRLRAVRRISQKLRDLDQRLTRSAVRAVK